MAKTKAKRKAKEPPKPLKLLKSDPDKRMVWEITLDDKTVAQRWGAVYGKQKQKTQSYATPEKAKSKYDELVAGRREDGYAELGELAAPTVTIARDAGMEAAIREDREDPAAYLVYADWLQAHGAPHGEMIVLAHAKKQKKAEGIAKKIGMPQTNIATVGWRWGFWQWLRLENDADWMDDKFEALPIVERVFASPLCAVLEELRIGILRWDYEDQPGVIAAAGRHPWAKDLAKLRVGDVGRNIDMDHHTIGDVGKAITKSFPNLRSLFLHSGSRSWRSGKESFAFAGLALPKLTELTIETCAMTSKRMKALTAATLPALERLEVWFGAKERDANARVADVMPILEGKFPKLRHLGLRNSELDTDFVRLLPGSKIAKQLESLDLSMGILSDSDAGELAEGAKQLAKLKALDISESYVTAAGLKTLKAAFKGIAITNKHMKEPYDWNPEGRYVSVHE